MQPCSKTDRTVPYDTGTGDFLNGIVHGYSLPLRRDTRGGGTYPPFS